MPFTWKIVDSGKMDPQAIMAKDATLLEELSSEGTPMIHFYEWSVPCLTFGYFIDPSNYLDLRALEECGIHLAKRPTGGGVIFHLTDFAFSLLIPAHHPYFSPNTLDNYALVNGQIALAIKDLTSHLQPVALQNPNVHAKNEKPSFCMAKLTSFDLAINGKKLGGAAQRRTKKGLLHQGSLSLLPPPFELVGKVLKDPEILRAMNENSEYLFSSETDHQTCRDRVKKALKIYFT